ncbi:MAG: PqqD family protein [Rhodocyclaceae bacterium]|nr:PqqD family protein [Rhodocyclaceae bacterium]
MTKVFRKPGAPWTELDGLVVMMSVSRSRCFEANRLGSEIWMMLEYPRTVSDIVQHLVARYKVEPARCEQDVSAFLQELVASDMIGMESDHS